MTSFTPDMQIGERIETPSQSILKDAFAPVTVTDANGRTIAAARLKPSERFDIKRMMGAEAENRSMFEDIFLVSHCRSIDGERISKPASILQAKALMDRLQDEGLNALGQAFSVVYGFDKREAVEQTAKN